MVDTYDPLLPKTWTMALRKKQRLQASPNTTSLTDATLLTSFDALTDDTIIMIFGFLPPEDIMRTRLSTKLRAAACAMIIPPSDYRVRRYKVMDAMTKALPNMQQITIDNLGFGQKYVDGEEPNEDRVKYTDGHITRDIVKILTSFTKLRILELHDAPLNGRYALLFKLPLLQKLTIRHCDCLKWDMTMLEGFPLLKELHCESSGVSGNIKDLRVLKDTLEQINLYNCQSIEGDFMDLADLCHLKTLDLGGVGSIVGDVQKIIGDDFQALEELHLPKGVIGGKDYQFELMSEVADVMDSLHRLRQRIPTIVRDCYWKLSVSSAEYYDVEEYAQNPAPPFIISFVQAGSRVGWRWSSPSCPRLTMNRVGIISDTQSNRGNSCEVNWLDNEPDRKSSGYETYTQEMQSIQREIDFYKGYSRPPTEEEYNQLCKEANID